MQERPRAGRIAIVRYGIYPGDAHVRRNVLALREAGFDVDVICHQQHGLPCVERIDGATVLRLPIQHRRGSIARYAFEYAAFPLLAAAALAIRSVPRRYDYVEIDTLPDWLILAGAAPKILGAKLVLYMFEDMPALLAADYQLSRRHPLTRALLTIARVCAVAADRVIVVSDGIRDALLRQGIPADHISFVPNVPDEQVFFSHVPAQGHDGASSRQPVARRDGPQATRGATGFRLVTHGSLLQRYGIQTLLEAMSIARPRVHGLHLDIIGDGEYRAELETLTATLGLKDSVSFSGTIPFESVAARLLHADVAVIPRWDDALPLKLMEYLALGLPIISSRLPSIQRRLGESCAVFVEPRSAEDLAEAIVKLYGDPARREELATNGRRLYEECFTWARTKQEYLKVYGDRNGTHGASRAWERADPRAAGDAHLDVGRRPWERGRLARPGRGSNMRWLPFVLGQSRGLRNAATRLPTILQRFGWTAAKSERNLRILLDIADRYHAHPTFAITAMTARRNPRTVERLLRRGVELAAHGYVHNDYASLSAEEQLVHVRQARDELAALGAQVRGWRCPYFRWNAATLPALEANGFDYDSTSVYVWPVYEEEGIEIAPAASAAYARLCALFSAKDATSHVVLPTVVGSLIQIPASLPQDEDMVDRLHLDDDTMARVWRRMLHDTHERGEVLVLNLHPERAALCARALSAVLEEARRLGDVWVATLGEIAQWWRARNDARVGVEPDGEGGWRVQILGPDRLTTTCAGQVLRGSGMMTVRSSARPLLRCAPTCSGAVRQRLRDAGYLCEDGGEAGHAYALDLEDILPADGEPDAAVRHVQGSDAALVKLKHWPAGYRSCLSITGDIDAITLIDFAMRLREF